MNNFNIENAEAIHQYTRVMNESMINEHGLSYFLKHGLKLSIAISESDEQVEQDLKKLEKLSTFIKNTILLSGLPLTQHFTGILGKVAASETETELAKHPTDSAEPREIKASKEELLTRLFKGVIDLNPTNFKTLYKLIEKVNLSSFAEKFTKNELQLLTKIYVVLLALELISKDKKSSLSDKKSRSGRIYKGLVKVIKKDISELTD